MVVRLSRFGLHKATMLVPIMVAWPIISPPFWGPQEVVDRTNTTYLGWMAAVFLVGTLFPVIVIPLLMRKRTTEVADVHAPRGNSVHGDDHQPGLTRSRWPSGQRWSCAEVPP